MAAVRRGWRQPGARGSRRKTGDWDRPDSDSHSAILHAGPRRAIYITSLRSSVRMTERTFLSPGTRHSGHGCDPAPAGGLSSLWSTRVLCGVLDLTSFCLSDLVHTMSGYGH